VRNRFQIEENVRGGVEYLAWLIRLFGGDLRLAIAAYYAGERPILARGLDYSSPDVYSYVSRVARLYRTKRVERMQRVPAAGVGERKRGDQ
jgi:soluble lytic murein transglycosylase-like protein